MSCVEVQRKRFLSIVSNLSSGVPVELLQSECRLFDLGFDSVRIVDLLMALEDEFRITFDDNDLGLENLQTVGMVWELLSLRLASRTC